MKNSFKQYPKLLIASALLILFTSFTGFYLFKGILKSADEIIADNKNITRTAVAKLLLESEGDLPPVWEKHLKGKNKITKADERVADSLLSDNVQEILNNFHGMEGGFYFFELDEFLGYSFPTIDEPKPAFGPPPRSYNIIRNQVRNTIKSDTLLTRLHQFDPAIFPLSTQPIYIDGEIIGAAWARVHIERKLATTQHIQSGTFFLTAGAILLGLAIVTLFGWFLIKKMNSIKEGLNKMKADPSYRLKEDWGAFGFISRAINDMTDTQQKEQEKRKKLERELFQKEKMATLGNLVAGTAHEINTPISIIKTRVQIWERKLRRSSSKEDYEALASDKSLQMVHREISRVSSLIKRLLFFSKPIGKKKTPIDLHEVLEEKIIWLQDAYPGQVINFRKEWDPLLPPVLADQESLEHVFINVLKNSVEASGINCTLQIHTRYLPEENTVMITFKDNGEGMPEKIMNKIYDPFFTTKDQGTGLGLSISYEIIKAHHGTIHFENPAPTVRQNGYIANNAAVVTDKESTDGTLCIISLPVI